MRRLLLMLLAVLTILPLWADDGEDYATNSVLSSGTWVKIRIDKPGVYQITHSSLRSMGFSNPERVKLYGMNVEVLPESGLKNLGEDVTELPLYRTADKVLFYGRGTTRWNVRNAGSNYVSFNHFNNPYTNYKYYLLTEGDNPMEFPTYSYEVASDAASFDVFPEHALIESDGYSYMNSGRTFFESYDYQSNNTRSYTLNLPGYTDNGNVTLDVQFCAAGTSVSTVYVTLNSSDLGKIEVPKLGNYDHGILRSRSFTVSSDVSSQNTVKLVHDRTSGISGHLDYIRAGYFRKLQLDSDYLLFRPCQDGDLIFNLSGSNENTVVWRVTSLGEIEGVKATMSDGKLRIPFTSENTDQVTWKTEELVALNPSSSFPTPTVVGKIANQDLHALGNLDLVIVVPASGKLVAQAQRLADAHTTYDSLRSVVLTIDKVYNEFSGGTPDATALRRFMKMLYENSTSESNRPKNLLLFGDGVWDNRMITGGLQSKSPDDYLLCYESDNSLSKTESYVMEEYFVLVDDTPSLLYSSPRIGVGRIPVLTSHEAKGVVDKLIGYMSNKEVGSWKNLLCFICDDGNNNLHMKDGEDVIKNIESVTSSYRIRRIYTDTYERETTATGSHYPNAKVDIDKLMRDGVLVMDYTGHGAPGQLAHEQLLMNNDFENWITKRLPLWFTAACDVSPFDMNKSNIGESAILNPDGSAMGFVGTARTVYSDPNRQMNIRFMTSVLSRDEYGRQYTLGEALMKAKRDLIDSGSSVYNRIHYHLLGDPAMKLALPTYNIVIDEINGMPADSEATDPVYAGEVVTVKGHIEGDNGLKDDTFNGLIYPTIMDNVELVTCLNNPFRETNGNDTADPFTFNARMKMLYTVADSVQNGQFTFKFPIPLDNNYSGEEGLISLYATSNDHLQEAHGSNSQFRVAGTSEEMSQDTIGPVISPVYLNTEHFASGDVVNETPLLMAYLSDKDGINMTGSGIGHDIEAMIDNNELTTYSLNSYFIPTTGEYGSGRVEFSIPALSDGYHTLTMRAYDILNNPSTSTIEFYVNNGEKPKIFSLNVNTPVNDEVLFTIENDRPQTNLTIHLSVYDVSGRLVYKTSEKDFNSSSTYTFAWNMGESNAHLVPGVYIVKAGISTADGPQATDAKKFIVVRRK